MIGRIEKSVVRFAGLHRSGEKSAVQDQQPAAGHDGRCRYLHHKGDAGTGGLSPWQFIARRNVILRPAKPGTYYWPREDHDVCACVCV